MQRMRRTESPPFHRESVVPAAHQPAVADLDVLMRAKNENPVNPPQGGGFGIPTVGDGKPSHLMGSMGSRATLSRNSHQPSKWRRTTPNLLGLHGDSAKEDSGEDEDDEGGDEDDAGKDSGKDAAEGEADKMMED
jgi:hypothetical protein